MQPLSPEDREFFQALSGELPGTPAEQALRADMLELGRLKREITEDNDELAPEQQARRARMMARLHGERLLSGARPIDGQQPLPAQPSRQTAIAASVDAWARSLSMSVEAAIEALRALLAPQQFGPAYGAASQGQPVTAREIPAKAGLYSLTVTAALNDPSVFYLLVRVDEMQLALAKGRTVTVRIGDVNYPMGLIDENGIAELEVQGPLPTGMPLEVFFGGREGDPDLS